jgi:hypothetical protein
MRHDKYKARFVSLLKPIERAYPVPGREGILSSSLPAEIIASANIEAITAIACASISDEGQRDLIIDSIIRLALLYGDAIEILAKAPNKRAVAVAQQKKRQTSERIDILLRGLVDLAMQDRKCRLEKQGSKWEEPTASDLAKRIEARLNDALQKIEEKPLRLDAIRKRIKEGVPRWKREKAESAEWVARLSKSSLSEEGLNHHYRRRFYEAGS